MLVKQVTSSDEDAVQMASDSIAGALHKSRASGHTSSEVDELQSSLKHFFRQQIHEARLSSAALIENAKAQLLSFVANNAPIRVALGEVHTQTRKGWVCTTQSMLDATSPAHFQRLLGSLQADAFVAEHVWEHMTVAEGLAAASLCFKHLRPGGRLRLAVPDGLRQMQCARASKDDGHGVSTLACNSSTKALFKEIEDGHLVQYTPQLLHALLLSAGFEVVVPLEYHDAQSAWQSVPWAAGDYGRIARARFNASSELPTGRSVSIVFDAIKPLERTFSTEDIALQELSDALLAALRGSVQNTDYVYSTGLAGERSTVRHMLNNIYMELQTTGKVCTVCALWCTVVRALCCTAISIIYGRQKPVPQRACCIGNAPPLPGGSLAYASSRTFSCGKYPCAVTSMCICMSTRLS
jgi:predicted SAM-dependent methyltransferase